MSIQTGYILEGYSILKSTEMKYKIWLYIFWLTREREKYNKDGFWERMHIKEGLEV